MVVIHAQVFRFVLSVFIMVLTYNEYLDVWDPEPEEPRPMKISALCLSRSGFKRVALGRAVMAK